MRRDPVEYALLVQALRMSIEVYRTGGMGKDAFVRAYVGRITPRVCRVARQQGIDMREVLANTNVKREPAPTTD